MPQQLIYTSSPRGLVVGRSGYCTVACTEGMREALQSRLEQISYFEHGMLAGTRHPDVCVFRILDIRGTRFHCLSRIVDAGLDFTKRTNFTAHHLVFTTAEAASLPPPPVIFLHWNGWRNGWTGDPQWLKNENWGNLFSLPIPNLIPCRNWQTLTGDAANAALWLEPRPEFFVADGFDHTRTLALLAESFALQAVRSSGNAWELPFTTFLQEGDDPAEFRIRLVYTGTSAHARLSSRGAVLVPLRDARPKAVDEGTAACARCGLRIVRQPEDATALQNERLLLRVEATSAAALTYQWCLCSAEGKPVQEIAGAIGPELKYDHLKVGYNYFRVIVHSAGASVPSRVAKIAARAAPNRNVPVSASVPVAPAQPVPVAAPASAKKPKVWSDAGITLDEDDLVFEKEKTGNPVLLWGGIASLTLVLLLIVGYMFYKEFTKGDETISVTSNEPVAKIAPANDDGSVGSDPSTKPASTSPEKTKPAGNVSPQNSPTQSQLKGFALIWSAKGFDEETINGIQTQIKTAEESINSQKETVKQNRENIRQIDPKLPADQKKQKRDPFEQAIAQAQKEENINRNQKSEFEKRMKLIEDGINRNAQLNQDTLDGKMQKIFQLSTGGKVYWQATELLDPRTKTATNSECGVTFEASLADSKFRFSTITNVSFSVTKFEAINNQLKRPVLIVFSTNSEPLSLPMAKVLVWPCVMQFSANCDANGIIKLDLNQHVIEELNSLRANGAYDLQLSVSYGDGKGGSCQTNYSQISTNLNYAELGRKMKCWKENSTYINSLLGMKGLGFKGLKQPSVSSTNLWEEIGKTCELLTQGRIGVGTVDYDFENDLSGTQKRVIADLDSNHDLQELEKEKIKNALDLEHLQQLAIFIKEEGAMSMPSLKQAQERLNFYGGKTGIPTPTILKATVEVKMVNQSQYNPLIQFSFR